jgi:hypothetical protein
MKLELRRGVRGKPKHLRQRDSLRMRVQRCRMRVVDSVENGVANSGMSVEPVRRADENVGMAHGHADDRQLVASMCR